MKDKSKLSQACDIQDDLETMISMANTLKWRMTFGDYRDDPMGQKLKAKLEAFLDDLSDVHGHFYEEGSF